MNNKILVIVAHPDDEVLGCGGTIFKHTKKGDEVFCLFLGRGKSSRYDAVEKNKTEAEQSVLEEEAHTAGKILGISELFFEDFPDQQYDTVPFLDIIKAIEKIKNKIKPNIIFTHHAGDLNLDHQITFKAVLTACRPIKSETVKEIYSFENPSSTEWASPKGENYFMPNVFVDISDNFDKKIKALSAYKSEIKAYPHPRSVKAIEIIAQRWGTTVSKEMVEAFELIRDLR